MFCEKSALRSFAKFAGIHLCQRLFFIKKETLAEVFFCEFCEIFMNTFFHRTYLVEKDRSPLYPVLLTFAKQ